MLLNGSLWLVGLYHRPGPAQASQLWHERQWLPAGFRGNGHWSPRQELQRDLRLVSENMFIIDELKELKPKALRNQLWLNVC